MEFSRAYGKDTFRPAQDSKVTKPPLSAPDAALRRFRIVHAFYLTAFAVVMLLSKGIMARITIPGGRWLFALARSPCSPSGPGSSPA